MLDEYFNHSTGENMDVQTEIITKIHGMSMNNNLWMVITVILEGIPPPPKSSLVAAYYWCVSYERGESPRTRNEIFGDYFEDEK